MRKRIFWVIVFCFFVASTATEAAEIFLMLSFRDSGKVFRVKTDYERLRPIGLFFDCDRADGFYIDNLKDFRMLSFKSPESFAPVKTTLFRQVFDGQISLADSGGKTSLHQDQRNQLIKGSVARPVYRTVGAPLSCGPGRKISVRPNSGDFAKDELEILPEHNWYQIANSAGIRPGIKMLMALIRYFLTNGRKVRQKLSKLFGAVKTLLMQPRAQFIITHKDVFCERLPTELSKSLRAMKKVLP
jgi:hypothetical protein